MDDKIEKLAEEVGASKDAQWKQIMQEVIDSSKMEIANLQDQLNRQRVTFNEQKVLFCSCDHCRSRWSRRMIVLPSCRMRFN